MQTEMGQLYEFLGLSVGLNLNSLSKEEKREAYSADITYSTNNELGFDYLRDNMVLYNEHKVQRPLFYAVIDEVDSILIDEARTPLIISGQAAKAASCIAWQIICTYHSKKKKIIHMMNRRKVSSDRKRY